VCTSPLICWNRFTTAVLSISLHYVTHYSVLVSYIILWRIGVLDPFTSRVYITDHFWTPNITCSVLETPFGLLLWFIYDFNSRHYNLFLQWALTLWRCVSDRSWFLCSCPLISFDLVFCDLRLWSLLFICLLICLLWSVRLAASVFILLPLK
jgi:hypothetical protein